MTPTIRPYQEGRTGGEANRASQVRRDNDTVVVPKVTLYDVDYAIYYHLVENLKLAVEENGGRIPVPVMFSNGEKWSQIRQHGYLRDGNKKVMAPLVMIRRNSVNNDDRLPSPSLNNFSPAHKLLPYKSMNMQYDRVAGQYVSKESYEYFLVGVPNYVRIDYELVLWTDMQEQMNQLVQTILDVSDNLWGDAMTFRANVQSTTHENVNVPGEDRIVKTVMSLLVDAGLRQEYTYSENALLRAYSTKRVRFMQEGTEEILVDQFAGTDFNVQNIADTNDLTDHFNLRKKLRIV